MPARTIPARFMFANSAQQKGFTLLELVLGMVVFAIAMTALASAYLPQINKSIDPIWQTRAVTLAKSLSNEISSKAFDENSGVGSTSDPCGISQACTTSANLGPDSGESRATFDDIDDFHGLVLQGSNIASSLSNSTSFSGTDVYAGFSAQIAVFYDSNADGINDDDLDQDNSLDTGTLIGSRKLIRIIIQTPSGENMAFAMFKDNF